MPSFGVYVHLPLCERRCGYCDFATVVQRAFPFDVYLERILAEGRARAPAYQPLELTSIYLGGGSPSLWSAERLSRLVDGIASLFVAGVTSLEVTVELNPQDASLEQLAGYRRAGINRLSIGIQSLDDDVLQRLTRQHSARAGRTAFKLARAAGFDNVSCDVIFGLAGQSVAQHVDQLAQVVALQPEHVSLYQLTLSEDSALFQAGMRPVDDDRSAAMLEAGRELLERASLDQYEVSNYARAGRQAVHNSAVWAADSYLGLGASAHSMWVDGDCHVRVENPRYETYLAAPIVQGAQDARRAPIVHVAGAICERTSAADSASEVLLLGLRTRAGVSRSRFAARFGQDPVEMFDGSIRRLVDAAMLEVDVSAIRPTRRGILFADELFVQLLARGGA